MIVTSERSRRRQRWSRWFGWCCTAAIAAAMAVLALLLASLIRDGIGVIDWEFLTSYPSRIASRAGIKSALVGTLLLMGLIALIAIPLGVATAVYLEEFAPRNRFSRALQLNISNLAGVPSVVYGILGLAIFVRWWQLGRGLLAGALTLSLLILPTLIIAAQEALRAVPDSLRRGALALGATRWQMVAGQVLPAALPGVMTGVILALSRAIGEAAPLIVLGALTYVPFLPTSLRDPFTALPIQIFNWAARPQPAFHQRAAGAILVLLAILLLMNAIAVYLRERYRVRT